MAAGLAWLVDYNPGTFDAILDATEPGTSDTPAGEPEPYYMVCGVPVGIFLAHGTSLAALPRRDATAPGSARPYDARHPAVIGWRSPAQPRRD